MSGVKQRDFSINSNIGPNSSVKGDIEAAGFTRVDGSLRGNLSVQGRIIVGENARLKSNISCTSITIGGVVDGNVLASERVVVLATGLVLGDIITRRIQADDGCLIHGRITVCSDDAKWSKTIGEYQDAQGVKLALSGYTYQPEKTDG